MYHVDYTMVIQFISYMIALIGAIIAFCGFLLGIMLFVKELDAKEKNKKEFIYQKCLENLEKKKELVKQQSVNEVKNEQ